MDLPTDRVAKFLTVLGLIVLASSARFGYSTYVDRVEEDLRINAPTPNGEKLRSELVELVSQIPDCARAIIPGGDCSGAEEEKLQKSRKRISEDESQLLRTV